MRRGRPGAHPPSAPCCCSTGSPDPRLVRSCYLRNIPRKRVRLAWCVGKSPLRIYVYNIRDRSPPRPRTYSRPLRRTFFIPKIHPVMQEYAIKLLRQKFLSVSLSFHWELSNNNNRITDQSKPTQKT